MTPDYKLITAIIAGILFLIVIAIPYFRKREKALHDNGINNAGKDLKADIRVVNFQSLKWLSDQEKEDSIKVLYNFAEENAHEAIRWYLKAKKSKSVWSRWLRILAILLTTLGGLTPIITSLNLLKTETIGLVGQLGYFFLALAASCIAVDRFFGFSSGWIRYIKTADSIKKSLSEFRLDWQMMLAKHGAPLTPDQIQLMIQRVKEFVAAIDGQVEQETLSWVAEFQTSLTEIERSAKAQEEVSKPGAIDITVTNGMEAEDGFEVVLDGMTVKKVRGTKYQIGYVPPGPHKIAVSATVKGKALDASELVNVPPGVISKVTLALPVEEAQP